MIAACCGADPPIRQCAEACATATFVGYACTLEVTCKHAPAAAAGALPRVMVLTYVCKQEYVKGTCKVSHAAHMSLQA